MTQNNQPSFLTLLQIHLETLLKFSVCTIAYLIEKHLYLLHFWGAGFLSQKLYLISTKNIPIVFEGWKMNCVGSHFGFTVQQKPGSHDHCLPLIIISRQSRKENTVCCGWKAKRWIFRLTHTGHGHGLSQCLQRAPKRSLCWSLHYRASSTSTLQCQVTNG